MFNIYHPPLRWWEKHEGIAITGIGFAAVTVIAMIITVLGLWSELWPRF